MSKRMIARRRHVKMGSFLGLLWALACQSADQRPPNLGGAAGSTAQADAGKAGDKGNSASTTQPPGGAAFSLERGRDDVSGELLLIARIENCSLEARSKVDGDGLILTRHSDCGLQPTAYVALWRQILREAVASHGFVGTTVHLNWGRMAAPATDTMAPVMSRRLAASVRGLKEWDATRGTLKAGRLESFIRERAEPETIFPELLPVVQEMGFSVATEHVEMVLVGVPKYWPDAADANGFAPDEKLELPRSGGQV